MITRSIKLDEINEKWYLVDAKGVRLGRLATTVAGLLNGKNDVSRVDYHRSKTKVVVINAKDVDIHPRKKKQKTYARHSGYPNGFKEITFVKMMAAKPEFVIKHAIAGMIPKNKQREYILDSNLYIYADSEHKHEAQKPEIYN